MHSTIRRVLGHRAGMQNGEPSGMHLHDLPIDLFAVFAASTPCHFALPSQLAIRGLKPECSGTWSGRIKVGNRNGFCLFGCPLSGSKLVDSMQYVRAVVPVPAPITDADCYVL